MSDIVSRSMHFRVEYLLREAALKPEMDHFYMQLAAEWMVKSFPGACTHLTPLLLFAHTYAP